MQIFLFDSHLHSGESPDSHSDLAKMCEYAMSHGIAGFCVTDHFDGNHFNDGDWNPETYLRKTLQATNDAKKQYEGKLILHTGIEFAQQEFSAEKTAKALSIIDEYNIDFMIGSMHRGADAEDFSVLDFSKVDFWPLLDAYYQQLLETAKLNYLDILAHITYPIRYAKRYYHKDFALEEYDDITDEILKVLISNGKGIEINTSGIRQGHGETFPPLKTVKRFRELGGEIITVGSDSHTNTDICADFDVAFEMLKEAGFNYYCYFKERKPLFIPLE